jgi:pimeloyl-ACP methyl ester carboxylesterase
MLKWLGRLVLVLIVLIGAAALALYQPDVPMKELEARYGGPDSQFVTLISGARAHFRDQGRADAPPLLLLHGSNASLHTWEPWVAILSKEFRVLSVDLPGHGLTGAVPGGDYSQKGMAGFVLEFAAAMKLEKFALAGNSMGGGVAARFAIDNPGRLSHLILVDAGGFPSAKPRDPGLGFTLARMPVVQDLIPYIGPRFVFEQSLKTAFADDAQVTGEMIDRYWLMNRGAGIRQATMARFQTPPDDVVRTRAAEIKAPTLILWGDQDSLIPVDVADAFKAAIAGSELIVYPGIGHIPMEEVAERSAADTMAFLKKPLQ